MYVYVYRGLINSARGARLHSSVSLSHSALLQANKRRIVIPELTRYMHTYTHAIDRYVHVQIGRHRDKDRSIDRSINTCT